MTIVHDYCSSKSRHYFMIFSTICLKSARIILHMFHKNWYASKRRFNQWLYRSLKVKYYPKWIQASKTYTPTKISISSREILNFSSRQIPSVFHLRCWDLKLLLTIFIYHIFFLYILDFKFMIIIALLWSIRIRVVCFAFEFFLCVFKVRIIFIYDWRLK